MCIFLNWNPKHCLSWGGSSDWKVLRECESQVIMVRIIAIRCAFMNSLFLCYCYYQQTPFWDFSADVTTQQVSSLANPSFGVLTGSVNSPMTVTSWSVSFTKHLFSLCPMWKYKQEAKFVQTFTSKSVNTRSCILRTVLPLSLRGGNLLGDVVLAGRRGKWGVSRRCEKKGFSPADQSKGSNVFWNLSLPVCPDQ